MWPYPFTANGKWFGAANGPPPKSDHMRRAIRAFIERTLAALALLAFPRPATLQSRGSGEFGSRFLFRMIKIIYNVTSHYMKSCFGRNSISGGQ